MKHSHPSALLSFVALALATGACATPAAEESTTSESAYTNTSGESEPISLPASYSMRSTLGTGINTVFMKAYDSPCVEYTDATPGAPRPPSALGETKFRAQAITVGSTSELADALGIQAGMSVNYTGLVASGSVGVDFGFSKQSKTSSESAYVLVKAWGEATDMSQSGRVPKLTEDALQTWQLGPYPFASKCGNNYVSRRQVGAGVYLMYRFSAKEGVSKQTLHAALSGKLNTRVVSGEAHAEVNMDMSEALKVANMEFTMAVYGLMPAAAPRLDNLRAQKPEEVEALINLVFQSISQASSLGPDSQQFKNLATISLQSSPYHARLTAAQFTDLQAKHRQAGSTGAELDLLVPDMRKVQSGVDGLWTQMMAVSDAVADAEYIKENPYQFQRRAAPLASFQGRVDPYGMQGWSDKLEATWRGLKDQVTACKDGGTASEKYAACNLEACTPASTSAYCNAGARLAEFRAARPQRLSYWVGSLDKVSYAAAAESCRQGGGRLARASENDVASSLVEGRYGSRYYWLDDSESVSCEGFTAEDSHFMGWPVGNSGCTRRTVGDNPEFFYAALCVPTTGIFAE